MMGGQVLPLRPTTHTHDLDAEASVLSTLLLAPAKLAAVSLVVAPHDFYSDANRRIAESIWSLGHEGSAVDVTTVGARLRADGRLEQIGGTPYLAQILDATPAVVHAEEHAAIVADRARLRRLIAATKTIAAEGDAGTPFDELVARTQQALEGATSRGPRAQQPTPDEPFRGLPRLAAVAVLGKSNILDLATRAVPYLWRDIAIAGIVVVIAGGPGSGKTTLLFLVLVARANRGEPVSVLGREVTPAPEQTYQVLIEAEHSATSAARKLARSCKIVGVDEDALDRVILIARKSVRIGSPEWAEVGRLVAAGMVSDIALDTLARVAPADANSESEQVAIFDQIAQLIDLAPEDRKPVAWVVAHTRKADGADLNDVSGSVQRTGQADTVLLVQAERRDGRVVSSKVTFAKLREDPPDYPAPVEYSLRSETLSEVSAPPVDDRPLEERITERLHLGPQSKNALRTALRRSDADIEDAISNLFAARAIRTTTVTVRGKSCKAFELNAKSGSGGNTP